MSYGELLREMYPGLDPVIEDLFLLEPDQIAALPDRAPGAALAATLHADPRLHRFLIARYPPVADFLSRLLAQHGPMPEPDLVVAREDLAWELADWIVYQREPGRYDAETHVAWDTAAVTELVSLENQVVIDAGAGTGRVAFAVAPLADSVYAVEPVGALRRFIRQKAADSRIDNLYVLDGFLDAIPLPDGTADTLVTCQAIGWDLPAELTEIERVTTEGGVAIHLFGAAGATESVDPLDEQLSEAGYACDPCETEDLHILRYWRRMEPPT